MGIYDSTTPLKLAAIRLDSAPVAIFSDGQVQPISVLHGDSKLVQQLSPKEIWTLASYAAAEKYKQVRAA